MDRNFHFYIAVNILAAPFPVIAGSAFTQFDPQFEEVTGRRRTLVDGLLESQCRLLVKCNWTSFSISYHWGTTRQNVSNLAAFRRGWVTL